MRAAQASAQLTGTLGDDRAPPEACVFEDSNGNIYPKSPVEVPAELGDPDDPDIADCLDVADTRRKLLQSATMVLQPSGSFAEWAPLLESYGVQAHAAAQFSTLASKGAPGQAEATKILQHLLHTQGNFRRDASAWLIGSVQNSMEYLQDWDMFEGDHQRPRTSQHQPVPASSSGDIRASADIRTPGAADPWQNYQPRFQHIRYET